ncbi:BCCT family transporter [Staphylococcus pettenkoferi]|uniref:BCCT family transporter n=1 Tax=Staphylococcus pettenkoferi TaxID=170573 RepID=UPI0002431D46|nr:BCCT family transporter [Staphylococcus pettenkoferi]ASE37066.1 BCCT family transporter [Staphylococcus pettenkoferi]EHM71464.1 transporter, betaine/carnitine/choline family [Staphylococcus pettenkoferi VCU012]MCI2803598.1 BCCT family transporter [Staphylococcus pettenkoferi]MCY1574335.1 BCCT family transporter [Staphylococcus pettenkoferi]MCY1577514.1 BCCT family transporter [Staphylococcus pettenkoferi]
MKKGKVMDWTTFIGTVVVLLVAVIPMMVFPKASQDVITRINDAISGSLGAVYLALGLLILGFVLYIAFGKYGNVTLGKATDRPEFNNFSWAAMLFCAGIGSDILYWGVIEWAFYYQVPPNGAKGMTDEALSYATTYGMFHWGPIAWAIYVLPALPIGYLVFVKKKPVYKISQACRPILKGQTDKLLGKIVDILFIFGLLGGAATSLALGVPMISAGIERLTGLDGENMVMRSIILLTITVIFAISSYTGLKKGIQKLSDVNVWLSFLLLAFVFIIGPTVFMMETTVTSVGDLLKNFFHMATWLEPFGGIGGRKETNFPQQWTIFYWSWWIVYAPFIGLFIARISKGRTLKEVVLGTMVYGTLGCILFFGIFGNYAVYLQITHEFDVINFLNHHSTEATIIEVMHHLPMPSITIVLFLISAFLFLATTFDSGSYILASASQKVVIGEPLRANRLFWAFALCLLPFSLMLVGGERALEVLKTASILASVPLIVIFLIMMVSFMRTLGNDRIRLQQRADKHKEIERRSLRIVQVAEDKRDIHHNDNL